MLKINSESTDEVVECNNEMLMCVYESERKWKDNIVVEWGQRDVYKRQIVRNLILRNIDADTVEMWNICKVMIDTLMFINDDVIL